MAKTDLVCCLLRQKSHTFTPAEKILLEMLLFIRIYHELRDFFKSRYKDYQKLIKSNINQEEEGMNNGIKLMQEIIKDILSTDEYSLAGIATYTHIPEDVLSDVAAGMNPNPTLEVSRKLLELHIMVRRNLYDNIVKKIISDYSK